MKQAPRLNLLEGERPSDDHIFYLIRRLVGDAGMVIAHDMGPCSPETPGWINLTTIHAVLATDKADAEQTITDLSKTTAVGKRAWYTVLSLADPIFFESKELRSGNHRAGFLLWYVSNSTLINVPLEVNQVGYSQLPTLYRLGIELLGLRQRPTTEAQLNANFPALVKLLDELREHRDPFGG